jgi:cytochrome c oxidase subunit 1
MQKAPARAWEGAHGLEWTVPSPAPYHTFETPPPLPEVETTAAHDDFDALDHHKINA